MVWAFQCECILVSGGRLMQETIQYRHDSHFILSEWRKEHNHKGPFKEYVRPNILAFDPLPPQQTHTHTHILVRDVSICRNSQARK